MIDILVPIFYKILYMSMIGSIVGILIYIITKIFDNKISAKWKCIIWILPLLLLMVPINRIEINTSKNFVINTAIDNVESTLSSMHTEYSEDLQSDNKKMLEQNHETVYAENNQSYYEDNTAENNKNNISDILFYKIVPSIWILGVTISGMIFVIGNIKLLSNLKDTKKLEDRRIKMILISCKRKLNINKRIEVKLQRFNKSPCIYGVIHPKILVSEEFLDKDNEIIENVFMHELSHYKRKDMITNYILLTMTMVHWFNPFVYTFFKKIRQEMELATDEIALKQMNKEEKKKYGLTLISLLQTYEAEKVATKILCITDDNKNMERRIRKIKLSNKLSKQKVLVIALITIFIICIISPFIIKPTNAMNANVSDNITYEDNNMNSEFGLNTNINSTNESLEDQSEEGIWKPYRAENNGVNVPLSAIYGSGISSYGGGLILNNDGTYTEFIGIYSPDIEDDLQGKYIISNRNIYLDTNNGNRKNLKYINDNTIVEELEDGTKVYFRK